MNKSELLNTVKQWIIIDDEIKNLSSAAREKRKEKKQMTNCSPCFVGSIYNKLKAIYNEYK